MALLLAGRVFGALSAGALDHAFSSDRCLIDLQLARGRFLRHFRRSPRFMVLTRDYFILTVRVASEITLILCCFFISIYIYDVDFF